MHVRADGWVGSDARTLDSGAMLARRASKRFRARRVESAILGRSRLRSRLPTAPSYLDSRAGGS